MKTPLSPSLARVARGNLCAGCGLCSALAGPDTVAMETSNEGYLRPRQDGAIPSAAEALIRQTCPGLGLRLTKIEGEDHPLWGPIVSVRTGHATDPALRHHASSGGALSAILLHLLASREVDAILQTAACPDLPIANTTVLSDVPEQVFDAAGSRYVPSAPLAGIDRHLEGSARLAFVGKPCDVAALRALARHDPRVDERFPIMMSFFCAGVPSLDGARELLRRLQVKEEDVVAFKFRGDGWPGEAAATDGQGRTVGMSYADSWGQVLNHLVQFRCKICADGVGSFADIACADAWDCDEKGYPVFNDSDGQSLVVGRTSKGVRLISAAETSGAIKSRPISVDAITAMQPGQVHRKTHLMARLIAVRAMLRPAPSYVGLQIVRSVRPVKWRAQVRQFLGTVRRLLKAR